MTKRIALFALFSNIFMANTTIFDSAEYETAI